MCFFSKVDLMQFIVGLRPLLSFDKKLTMLQLESTFFLVSSNLLRSVQWIRIFKRVLFQGFRVGDAGKKGRSTVLVGLSRQPS